MDPDEGRTGQPTDRAGRGRAIQRVLLITLGLNMAAAAVKLIAAWSSGSLSLAAGGIDSVFDGAANIAGLVAVRAAARPPDADHPYGHRKYETLVAVGIAALLFVTCGRLAWTAIAQLVAGDAAPRVQTATLLAPVAAFVINGLASVYEGRRGRALGSELLVSDAGHTRADAGVSLALVGGLLAVRAGYPQVDPLFGLLIALVVARLGWGILRQTTDVLADAAAIEPSTIEELARHVPGVLGAHKVRSRGPGDDVRVDLHVQVDPALGIDRAHAIGHEVQHVLHRQLPTVSDVIVHVEPHRPAGPERP